MEDEAQAMEEMMEAMMMMGALPLSVALSPSLSLALPRSPSLSLSLPLSL
jgi:hypothetical protein